MPCKTLAIYKVLIKFELLLMSVNFPQDSHGKNLDNYKVYHLLLTIETF